MRRWASSGSVGNPLHLDGRLLAHDGDPVVTLLAVEDHVIAHGLHVRDREGFVVHLDPCRPITSGWCLSMMACN